MTPPAGAQLGLGAVLRSGPGLDAPDERGRTGLDQVGLRTRQSRLPVYVTGHPDGMLVETAAGLLDDDDPATAIRRETEQELGVVVGELEHVFDVWMSPGSVTERLHFYAARPPCVTLTGGRGVRTVSPAADLEVRS